jgi:hypothetical protein
MRIALWGNTPLMNTSRILEIVTRISQNQVASLVYAVVKRVGSHAPQQTRYP